MYDSELEQYDPPWVESLREQYEAKIVELQATVKRLDEESDTYASQRDDLRYELERAQERHEYTVLDLLAKIELLEQRLTPEACRYKPEFSS